MGRNFSSDHVAPACDAIMSAVHKANEGFVTSYGGDDLTAKLTSVASELFEKQVAIFPVTSGTAANALALSQVVPTFGAIYCYEAAHIVTDEAGAPAFFTGGAQLVGFPAADGKIRPEQLMKAVAFAEDLGIHHVKPGVVTLTQATEWGTVYRLPEIAAIRSTARTPTRSMLRRGPSNSVAAASAKARSAMACKLGTAPRSSLSASSYGELAIVFLFVYM